MSTKLTAHQRKFIKALKAKRDCTVFGSIVEMLEKHSMESRSRILRAAAVILGVNSV